MAIVTPTLSVNDVATQAHELNIFALQIKLDIGRNNSKAGLNFEFTIVLPFAVAAISVVILSGENY
jgi:hypothetical protein